MLLFVDRCQLQEIRCIVIEQCGDDRKRYPVAFAGHQTNAAEAKYVLTELEVAALVYAVEHFEVYIRTRQSNYCVY